MWSSYVLQMIPANGLKAKSWLKKHQGLRVVNIRPGGIDHYKIHSKTARMEIKTSDGNLYFTTVDDSIELQNIKSSNIAEEFKKILSGQTVSAASVSPTKPTRRRLNLRSSANDPALERLSQDIQ